MNVTFSGSQVQPNKYSKTKAAAKGALYTASVLGASTAISWTKQPAEMQKHVAKLGGKGKYALQYVAWLALFSAAGAVVSTALTAIANAVKPNHPPKAN